MLTFQEVSKDFNGIRALHKVTAHIPEGKITAIIGPNGAGKTTLLNVATGIYTPDEGDILLKGKSVSKLLPHDIARQGVGRSFQILRHVPSMTVLENVLLGLHRNTTGSKWRSILKMQKILAEEEKAKKRAIEELEFLNMADYADYLPSQLSTGHQRLVDIARAIIGETTLLLLDEPYSGLTIKEASILSTVLQKICQERNLTLMLVEHNMMMVQLLADKIIVLNFGRKVCEGTHDEVTSNPTVIDAYLGEDSKRC